MEQNKARMVWIDQLRSAAILLVILGHVSLPAEVNGIIYSFHMPLFFIITGLTTNRAKIMGANIKEYTVHQIEQLLIPYFWMNFLMYPIWYFAYHCLGKSKVTIPQAFLGILVGNAEIYQAPSNALWFVLVLMLAKILYACLIKLAKGWERVVSTAIILCAVVAFLDRGNARIWHFNVVFSGIVFIYVGDCLMSWFRKGGEIKLSKMKTSGYILIIGLLVALGIVTAYFNGRISMNANLYGRSVILFYVTSIAFSCAGILVAIKFSALPIRATSIITYIGQNTLLYVGVHIPILRVFKRLLPDLLSQYKYNVLAAFILYFGIALLCLWFNHSFPFVCGKKAKDVRKENLLGCVLLIMWCVAVPYYYLIGAVGFDLSNKATLFISMIGLGLGSGLLTLCGTKCNTKIKEKKG